MTCKFETKHRTITIPKKVIEDTITNIVSSLSLYSVKEVKFTEDTKDVLTFYVMLKNDGSLTNYINYISLLQKSLKKAICSSLNITNFFSIIIFE